VQKKQSPVDLSNPIRPKYLLAPQMHEAKKSSNCNHNDSNNSNNFSVHYSSIL